MDRLQAMEVFTKVVELNSFSKAAEALEITPASASTIIQKLEEWLNVRLLNRTTRKLNLTPEGAEYYRSCVQVLAAVEESEHALVGMGHRPRGKLRIDMPGSLGKIVLVPQIPSFRTLYPEIDIMIGFSDRDVDLVEDGVDCAIRVGPLRDSTLVAKKLGSLNVVTAASPDYLEQHGTPRTVADLAEHSAVHYFSSRAGRTLDLNFAGAGAVSEIKMKGNLAFNDMEAYVLAGAGGAGIIQAPCHIVHAYLEKGALVEILQDIRPPAKDISAVFPQNRHPSRKLHMFIDWAASLFGRSPMLSRLNELTPSARDVTTKMDASLEYQIASF